MYVGRPFDLADRPTAVAVIIGLLVKRLPRDRLGSHLAGQLVRCGTAPAANYAEAEGAESRRDFVHKMRLALKELRESLVWLRIAQRMEVVNHSEVGAAEPECGELIAIFVKSIETAKTNLMKVERRRPPIGG